MLSAPAWRSGRWRNLSVVTVGEIQICSSSAQLVNSRTESAGKLRPLHTHCHFENLLLESTRLPNRRSGVDGPIWERRVQSRTPGARARRFGGASFSLETRRPRLSTRPKISTWSPSIAAAAFSACRPEQQPRCTRSGRGPLPGRALYRNTPGEVLRFPPSRSFVFLNLFDVGIHRSHDTYCLQVLVPLQGVNHLQIPGCFLKQCQPLDPYGADRLPNA